MDIFSPFDTVRRNANSIHIVVAIAPICSAVRGTYPNITAREDIDPITASNMVCDSRGDCASAIVILHRFQNIKSGDTWFYYVYPPHVPPHDVLGAAYCGLCNGKSVIKNIDSRKNPAIMITKIMLLAPS